MERCERIARKFYLRQPLIPADWLDQQVVDEGSIGYTPLTTTTKEEWLFRPVFGGMCSYEDIAFNKFNLGHIAEMNELLDIKEENDRRRDAAMKAAQAAAEARY
jgi:hypothetical protein